jgi:hypothetical protein
MGRQRQFFHPAGEGKGILLLTIDRIDRTAIASHVFNADHPRSAWDDRLSNLDHLEGNADRGEGGFELSTEKRPN